MSDYMPWQPMAPLPAEAVYTNETARARTDKGNKKGNKKGYSVPKVAGVGAAMAVLGVVAALTVWRGPRMLTLPLVLSMLSSALVMLVITAAGRKVLEKVASGSVWAVSRAVCATDDVVCKLRSVMAAGAVWALCLAASVALLVQVTARLN